MRKFVSLASLISIVVALLAPNFPLSSASAADESAVLRDGVGNRILQGESAKDGEAPIGESAVFSDRLPFSFRYDEQPSENFLPKWTKSVSEAESNGGKTKHRVVYRDPETKLELACELTLFDDFPAVEWVLRFTNLGQENTPILENILPLDLSIDSRGKGDPIYHYGKGSNTARTDFLPLDETLEDGKTIAFPTGKQISQQYFPYFNLEFPGGGICGGIGWTGQWAMSVQRKKDAVRLQAGQQLVHLRLLPGESIRTPRILLVAWRGAERLRGNNFFRRLLLAHYVPRIDGQVVPIPISLQFLKMVNGGFDLNDVSEAEDIDAIAKCSGRGVEVFWHDAGWYENRWAYSGSWYPDKKYFPNGMKPVADAAHRAGMKFLLWFEPERVSPDSRIDKEHPEWLLTKGEPGWPNWPGHKLFNLGNPEARAWMTDFMSNRIDEYGIDIFRQDHNFHLTTFWRANDEEDRQGITEIRHVEGLYAMWDELHRRHPRLIIDNANWRCTGPDFETISRSTGSFTRSEWAECGADPVANQMATAALSLFLPIHGNGLHHLAPYDLRSVTTTGVNAGLRWTEPLGEKAIEEIKLLRPLCLGDFYPLTKIDVDEESWCAWQFHRPDLNEGVAVVFRRPKNPNSSFTANLKGLDAASEYEVDFRETFDIQKTENLTGGELTQLQVEIPSQPTSLLIHYKKK